jgi:hypothetical protein
MSEPNVRPGIAVAVPAQEERVVIADPLGGNPTPTPANPPQAGAASLPLEEEAQIYAAVIRQMYLVDHTFGNTPPNWETIYLVTKTDDGAGDPEAPKGDAVVLSRDILSEVTKQLTDLPAAITPVESRESVPTDVQNGSVDGGKGVIFTVGNIHPAEDGTVKVSASLYFGSLGAGGKTYILSRVDGAWIVTGTTGAEWIS